MKKQALPGALEWARTTELRGAAIKQVWEFVTRGEKRGPIP
jgi:hypothetical protein